MAINAKPQRDIQFLNGAVHEQRCTGEHRDSLDSELRNCNVLGIFCSFYLFEWAQKSSDKNHPLTSADILPFEFIFFGLTFQGVEQSTIT